MRSGIRRWSAGSRRFVHDESGVALVEFSLVVMMMAVLAFGAINWARFFLLRGQLADAIRDAARYGATIETEDATLVSDYARTVMANSTATPSDGTITVTFASGRVRVALTGLPFVRATTLGMGAGRTIAVAAEFRRER